MDLSIKDVVKTFENTVALKGISVNIRSSEFIAILGPSGCGKTTLLRILAGFMTTSSGSVSFGDRVYSSEKRSLPVEERNIGMVFQSFALWPHMTVKEHLYFPLESRRNKSLTQNEKDRLVDKTLKMAGLAELADRLPEELSGGQKQRVSLARAIVSEPEVLLMDEPLSALDAELRVHMRKEIQDIHQVTGSTIIYVTHDQEEALAMADRIIVMKDGKIEQIGTPKEIYLHPETAFVASFVSKCNFIPGKWEQETFTVKNTGIQYEREQVTEHFIQKGLYPIRPEQLYLLDNGNGIKGTIQNKQFIGREWHYTVKTVFGDLSIYEEPFQQHEVGEEVFLAKR